MENHAWKQGSYVVFSTLPDDLQAALKESVPCKGNHRYVFKNSSLVILVSQDCDIQAREDLEPWLQFIATSNGGKTSDRNENTRSARRLALNDKYNDKKYELTIQRMGFLTREQFEVLTESHPTPGQLTDTDRQLVRRWLARRYNRNGLPDNFNKRIAPIIGCLSNLPIDMYIRLGSMQEQDFYKVALIGVPYPPSSSEEALSPEKITAIRAALQELTTSINQTEGLKFDQEWLDDNELSVYMDREELTLSNLDKFDLWNLEYISLKEGDFSGATE